MTTMSSALRAIGGGQVVDVIPANAIALAGLGDTSPGNTHGSGSGGSKTPSERPDVERLVSLG